MFLNDFKGRRNFDVIVVGVGSMGAAICEALAERGLRVLGIEQSADHTLGGCKGETRLIRRTYNRPAYYPLIDRAFTLWREKQIEHGSSLLQTSGLLMIRRDDDVRVLKDLEKWKAHDIVVERMAATDIHRFFPAIQVDDGQCGLYEAGAGVLFSERTVNAFVDLALRKGATILKSATVLDWSSGPLCRVVTTKGTFSADKLILSCGAWVHTVLPQLAPQVSLRRKTQVWLRAPHTASLGSGCPVFASLEGDRHFWGFPAVSNRGVKLIEDTGGTELHSLQDEADELDVNSVRQLVAFARNLLNIPEVRLTGYVNCVYDLTKDKHFLVDEHPAHPNVIVATGFSGHGFAFVPLIGRIVCDMICSTMPDNLDISHWRIDPTFFG